MFCIVYDTPSTTTNIVALAPGFWQICLFLESGSESSILVSLLLSLVLLLNLFFMIRAFWEIVITNLMVSFNPQDQSLLYNVSNSERTSHNPCGLTRMGPGPKTTAFSFFIKTRPIKQALCQIH